MKYIYWIIGLLLLVSPTFGASGLRLLAVEAGARPVGMGGAFTAIVSDPYSAAYNPAAIIGVTTLKGSIGHNTYWSNTSVNTGYIIFEKRSVYFNVGIQFGEVSGLEARDNPTEDPLYLFENQNISIKAGLAVELYKKIAIGFSGGWLLDKIDTYSDGAFSYDFGVAVFPIPDMSIGLSALNRGPKIAINNLKYRSPLTYRFGITYDFKEFQPAFDLVEIDETVHAHMGVEFKIAEMLYPRIGFRTKYDTKKMSAGVGFKKRNFRIDYAFQPYKSNLNDSHLFNLTFTL